MNPIPEGTAGDERLLLLAMALDNRVGLTFDEILDKGLLGRSKDIKPDSLVREFNRYRHHLEEIGIRVIETNYGGVRRFKLDAHVTYADSQDIELSAEETLTLVTLLTLYLESDSAPYAADARKARDKIASIAGLTQMLGSGDKSQGASGKSRRGEGDRAHAVTGQTAAQGKAENDLLRAYAEHVAVEFDYTKPQGSTDRRHVRIYGIFEYRAHTYYIARDDSHGAAQDNTIKVFRDDRINPRTIELVSEETYDIPLDFSVRDYIRLPFQYGSEKEFTALFHVKQCTSLHDAAADTLDKGCFIEADGETLWAVEANDFPALVRWAVGMLDKGFVPREPHGLAEAMVRGLEETERVNG